MKKVSILLPCYNEESNILKLVEIIKKKVKFNFEIIIINDGSTDNTINILKIFNKSKKVRVINLKENIGKAYALEIGLKFSRSPLIAILDSDLQYDPNDLNKMYQILNNLNYEFVNGLRVKRKDNLFTNIFSKFYRFLLSVIFNIKMYDYFSGIKMFKKNKIRRMEYIGLIRFYLIYLSREKLKISEIEVKHIKLKNNKSSYNFIDRVILSIMDIATILFCILIKKKYLNYFKKLSYLIYFLFIFITIIFNEILLFNHLNITIFLFINICVLIFKISINRFFLKKNKKTNFIKKFIVK